MSIGPSFQLKILRYLLEKKIKILFFMNNIMAPAISDAIKGIWDIKKSINVNTPPVENVSLK